MTEKYAWSRQSDDEIWQGGPCKTVKECVEEAIADGYDLSDTFAVGLIEPYSIDIDFADLIIERLQEDAYDEVGEVTEGWLDYVKRDDLTRLDDSLKQVINNWLKDVAEEPTFYTIAPCYEGTLAEALAEYQERVKAAPKGGKI
jgi:hypothetical protein